MNFKSKWESLRKFRTSGFLFIISFFLILFICNYWTYWGIKLNPNYTIGKVVKTWKSGKNISWHSKFTYTVSQTNYIGEVYGKFDTTKPCLIVYDGQSPRYSTIADYPNELTTPAGMQNISPEQADFD